MAGTLEGFVEIEAEVSEDDPELLPPVRVLELPDGGNGDDVSDDVMVMMMVMVMVVMMVTMVMVVMMMVIIMTMEMVMKTDLSR